MPQRYLLPPTSESAHTPISIAAALTSARTGAHLAARTLSLRRRTLRRPQAPTACRAPAAVSTAGLSIPQHAPASVALGPRPRILVIKLATLGDLLLATPALRALRLRYPAARIDLLTTPTAAPLLVSSSLVDHVYILDKYAFDTPRALLRRPWRLLPTLLQLTELRRTAYDTVLLPHHLTLRFGRLKYRLLLKALAPRLTAGLDNGHGGFLDLRVPDNGFGARHEAEYCQEVAQAVDASLPPGERGIHLSDLGWGDVCAPLASHPTEAAPPVIALHPGSGSYSLARRWPVDRYVELGRRLHDTYGARLLLVGGPEERPLVESLLDLLGRPDWAEDATGALSPHQLALRLSQCALFVGNDSFPMHLAASVGLPTVAIFGPSNADAWGPYTPDAPERARIVHRTDLACMPCIYRGHALGTPQGCPPRTCLTELSVAAVLRAVRAIYPAQPTSLHART
ncbi:MAG: glycosyltransferase family 9 protein [Ktedonobacterales bacterium]